MLGIIGAAYVGGLFIPLMNNDSAHHANIALHMYESGDFISLIDRGKDYLDKPHLLFWLSALSYKIFGVNSFAFKFPSFLFSILALYSTYRLGARIYSKRVGALGSLILATAYGFFLANNDVRMDALLTGAIIF
ncbi:MAG TPA: glycosyltransferase family 39 protein, partial [Cyclobacteriaceae bacterium]|nr:glycosyltransferase family 39 protein [Cyclobacteriaceae bacterium]